VPVALIENKKILERSLSNYIQQRFFKRLKMNVSLKSFLIFLKYLSKIKNNRTHFSASD